MILLDPTASLRWEISDESVPVGTRLTVALKSRVWRYEDGEVLIRVGSTEQSGMVWGTGEGMLAGSKTYDDWREDGYGAGRYPSRRVAY